MTSKLAQCILGWAKGKQRYTEPVNDAAVQKALGPDGQAKFARESSYYDRDVSMSAPPTPREALFEGFYNYSGVDMRHLGAFVRDPSAILGEDLIVQVNSIYQRHIQDLAARGINPIEIRRKADEAIRKLPFKMQLESNLEEAAKASQEVRDLLALRKTWEPYKQEIQKLQGSHQTNPIYKDYASQYFDFQAAGGQLYGRTGGTLPGILVKNAVGNLVAWNPMIATLNVFEFVPKATAYALMSGHSPAVVFKAFSNLMTKTKGNPFQRVQDWDLRGIYGSSPRNDNPLAFTDRSEELLRNLSASLGEVMGQAPELSVEKVAFVNRLGNEMQAYWTSAGSETVSLMRFSISAVKMYTNFFGQIYQGIKAGDMAMAGKAAGALAMFSVMTSIQTGATSAIPAPIAYIIKETDPESYEALEQMDQEFPGLNIAKNLGLNLADKIQPMAMPTLGAGYSVLTQDLMGGAKAIGKAPGDLAEGEFGLAGARLVEGLLGVGQISRIPGMLSTNKRIASALVKQLEEDSEINADLLSRVTESLGYKPIEE